MLLGYAEGDARGYADQALMLCRGLGLDARAVPWTNLTAATKDIATRAPNALVLVVGRADSLVVRGGAPLRAAYAAAAAKGGKAPSQVKVKAKAKAVRGVVVVAGLPSLGWVGDAALRAAGRNHVLSAGSEGGDAAPAGPRRLVHADGQCLLGKAADVANLAHALDNWVADGTAPCFAAAAYRYWASWQHDDAHALLPCAVLDDDEVAFCATLHPDDDVLPVIDEGTGAPAIRARVALTRPCVVRAPYGGNLAAVLQALALPSRTDDGGRGQEPAPTPASAAVAAACIRAWHTHTAEVAVLLAILAAVLVAVIAGVARWCALPSPTATEAAQPGLVFASPYGHGHPQPYGHMYYMTFPPMPAPMSAPVRAWT